MDALVIAMYIRIGAWAGCVAYLGWVGNAKAGVLEISKKQTPAPFFVYDYLNSRTITNSRIRRVYKHLQNPNNMKKFFSLLIAFVAFSVTCAKAQTSLIATLNHEGTTSMFYGSRALQQAHAAATDGDVITLSSGTFHSENITKAITLRGAGMAINAETRTEPTVLVNSFDISIPDETPQRLTIEGIYTSDCIWIKKLKNAMFLKNKINRFELHNNSVGTNLTFIHCRFIEGYFASNTKTSSASFLNCIGPSFSGENFTFSNCILGIQRNYINLANVSEYKNCIMLGPLSSSINTTMSFYNNLYITDDKTFTLTSANNTNVKIDSYDERIKYLLQYSNDNDYKLTEDVKAIMKGTDGTEVGIYGGNLPYDPTPTNPQITKFNVASKTTVDGKLSVDIEVKSAE